MSQALWIISKDEATNAALQVQCTRFNEEYGASFDLHTFTTLKACIAYGGTPFYLIADDIEETATHFIGCVFIQHGGVLPLLPDNVNAFVYLSPVMNIKRLYCDILHDFV